jgi:hypothetical protein
MYIPSPSHLNTHPPTYTKSCSHNTITYSLKQSLPRSLTLYFAARIVNHVTSQLTAASQSRQKSLKSRDYRNHFAYATGGMTLFAISTGAYTETLREGE